MNATDERTPEDAAARRIRELEERLAKLEAHIGPAAGTAPVPPPPAESPAAAGRAEDELEFEVGQNWFATVGIVVLTVGAGFTLSLPYAGLPPGVPSLIGFAL